MISVACDITAFAQNRFGGIARVCRHTAEELSRRPEFAVTGYYARGEKPEISGVASNPLRPWTRILGDRYDIAHSLCHRHLEVKADRHVYTVHDVWSLEPNRYQSPEFQRKLGARMRREIIQSDLIFTDSHATRTKLLQYGLIDEAKCLPVPVGVSIPDSEVTPPVSPPGFTSDSRYVLFVGRLENRKNLPHILDAVKPIHNLRLVLVGEPGYGFEESIKNRLASFPVDRLISLSRISEGELLWLYQSAVVAVQPSWEEGFGLPILEAMAAGCPVITSSCSAMSEVAGDAAVLVDPDAPTQSQLAIERLLDDPPFREHLISLGRKRSLEFSWGKYGGELARIYLGLSLTV